MPPEKAKPLPAKTLKTWSRDRLDIKNSLQAGKIDNCAADVIDFFVQGHLGKDLVYSVFDLLGILLRVCGDSET